MPKFKVGDKVKLLYKYDHNKGIEVGEETTVTDIRHYNSPYIYGLEKGGLYVQEEWIQLVQPEPMNYKIRVTPSESEAIQKCCFEMGMSWYFEGKILCNTNYEIIFVCFSGDSFKEVPHIWGREKHEDTKDSICYGYQEISPKDFLAKYSKSKPDPAHDIGGVSRSTYTDLGKKESGSLTVKDLADAYSKILDDGTDHWYSAQTQFGWLQTPGKVQTKKKGGLMSTVSKLAAKLLDADLRTLIKAGYLDSELNLTHEGQRALLIVLFQQKEVKAELVKAAKEDIKARKEECDCDD